MAYLPPMNGGRLNASVSSAAGGSVFGASLISTGTMNLVAGSNITLSQAGGNISFQAPNAHNVSFGGNMAGAAAMVSTGTLSLYGGNNITLSQNANNVTINGPAAGGGSINFSAGTTSSNLASVRFADSNGIGFGLNGSVITASYTQQAMFDAGVSTMGNTAGVTGTNTNGLFLAGSNNITLSQSTNAAGATVNIIGPTFTTANNVSLGINNGTVTASASFNQTQQTANIIQGAAVAGSTLTSGSLLFSNANGIGFGLNGSVLTASASSDGIQAVSAGTTNLTYGGLSFSNANNINFGLAGSTLTASYAGGAGGVAIAANASTFSTGTLGLNAAGGISLATGAQSLTISAPGTSSIQGTNVTIGTNGSTIGFSVAPMFDAGMIGGGIGSTLGTSGSSNTNGLALMAGSNVTLSQSTNAAGAYVTVNAGAASIPRWEYPSGVFAPISTLSNSQLSIQHMNIPFNLTANSAKVGGSLSVNVTSVNSTASVSMSLWMGLYTLSGSTLSLMYSGSANNSFSYLNTSASATSYMTGINGMRQLTVPLGTISASQGNSATITAGDYWVAAVVNSATNASNANNTFVIYGNNQTNINANAYLSPIGSNIANARDVFLFQGVYTANTTAGPQSIIGAQINNTTNSFVQRAAFYNLLYSATY